MESCKIAPTMSANKVVGVCTAINKAPLSAIIAISTQPSVSLTVLIWTFRLIGPSHKN